MTSRPPIPCRRPGVLVLLAVLSFTGCGGDGSAVAPEASDLPDVVGQWIGSAEDTFDDLQPITANLTQNGTEVGGTINSMIFRNLAAYPVTGRVTEGGQVTLQVLAADRGGCFDVTVRVTLSTSGRQLHGTYVIDRKASGCGRMPVPPPQRPFNMSRPRGERG